MMNALRMNDSAGLRHRMLTVVVIFALALCGTSCLKNDVVGPVGPGDAPVAEGGEPSAGETPVVDDPAAASGITLHLIIVADTNDDRVGKSVAVDSRATEALLEAVAEKSNGEITLKKIILEGYGATSENLKRAVRFPKVKSSDIVFFLYAGHGLRYQTTDTRWPLLDIPGGVIDFADIIREIRAKNPRQFILLADCCNEVADLESPRGIRRSSFTYAAVRRLFIDSQAKFVCSSSMPGQSAFGDDEDGGLFTASFRSFLGHALVTGLDDWSGIFQKSLNDVTAKARRDGEEQTPQFEQYF